MTQPCLLQDGAVAGREGNDALPKMYAEAGIRRAGPSLGLKHAAYSVVACMANGAHEGLQARCMAFDAAAWLGCGQVMMYRRPAQRYDVTCRTTCPFTLSWPFPRLRTDYTRASSCY
jgi:hypothetical protein